MRRNEPTLDDGVISTWRKQILKVTGQPLEGFPVGSVEGYPDQDDLHVHAAAQYCGMHILVTDDVKLLAYASTTESELTQNYETFSADDFLMHLTELSSLSLFAQVYVKHVKYALSRGYKDIDVCKALDRTKIDEGIFRDLSLLRLPDSYEQILLTAQMSPLLSTEFLRKAPMFRSLRPHDLALPYVPRSR